MNDMDNAQSQLLRRKQLLRHAVLKLDRRQTQKMRASQLQDLLVDLRDGPLSDLSLVPELQISAMDIPWHELDSSELFVLSRIDGRRCYADLLDLGGVGGAEARRLLSQWLAQGLIAHKRS